VINDHFFSYDNSNGITAQTKGKSSDLPVDRVHIFLYNNITISGRVMG